MSRNTLRYRLCAVIPLICLLLPMLTYGSGFTGATGGSGGSGNVSNSGTPVAGQVALWTDATTLQALTALPCANLPALTGDMTTSAGSCAATLASTTGSGPVARSTSPTFATPILGTPASGNAANLTNLPAPQLSGTITPATQDLITRTGTLVSGATGAGFTLALSTSTVTGTLADARLSANIPHLDTANAYTLKQTFPVASLGAGYLSTTKTAAAAGVTADLLCKIDSTGNVVTAAVSDVGILGICVTTATSGNPVEVATRGIVNCVADNTTVIGNRVIVGTATGGRCRDSGQANSTLVSNASQVVGIALTVATVGNPMSVQLFGPGHYGAKIDTLATMTSAQFRAVLSDPTGTGAAVFADTPTFTTKALFPDGTAGAPSIAFSGHATDGMYSGGAADIRWALAGVVKAVLNTSFGGSLQAVTLGVGLNGDIVLSRFAANNLQFGPLATATPAAQTLSAQDGAGTDIAGQPWTLRASRGTGAGAVGTLVLAASAAPLGTGTTLQTTVTHLTVGGGAVKSSVHTGTTGTAPAVSNTSANSCGTTAATLVGTDQAGKVTVGATAGTSCTVTFAAPFTAAPSCVVSNEITANLARATSTTTTTILAGTFVAGDVLAYQCATYF